MTATDARSQVVHKDISNTSSPIAVMPRTRSQSISSDRPSIGYGGLLSPPTSVNPEPLYIAASAASQIVTNDHDSHSEMWFDQHGLEPSGETALVAQGALKLVNNFLDQILFNFLSLSRSTSLASLRPAVSEVLKPKLAKDAIALADQELHEYLGGGEEEELLAFHNGLEPSGDWDLELVWKRTRLRCMVYSSLGDMEEEDEDHYTDLEQLDGPPGSNSRFSNNPGVVSPAVAIFLTSILEFMGEQVLVVAGQAAYHRLRAKHEREERDGTSESVDIADRVVVEETDMEKVALDRTLGRLWRGWKKRIRSPTPSVSIGRSFSRESLRSRGHSRINSISGDRFAPVLEAPRKSSTTESLLHEHAASIPLPMTNDDVREIEVPGLVYHSDEDEEQSEDEAPLRMRPKSMMLPGSMGHSSTSESSESHTPTLPSAFRRTRSNSLPSPAPSASILLPRSLKSVIASTKAAERVPAPEDSHDGQPMNSNGEKSVPDTEASKHMNMDDHEEHLKDHKGMLASVIAGAAAIGAVAVAGITAVAKGQAPETLQTPGEESDLEEAFIEEPRIMTASRASMHGRLTPDQIQAGSRPLSIRTQSIHSVRLVDVPSPHSPARSRHNSVGSMDHFTGVRSTGMARSASAEGQRGTSPVSRMTSSSPVIRQNSSLSQRQARNSTAESISELEEQLANPPRSVPAIAAVIPERSPLREISVPTSMTTPPSQHYDVEKSSIPAIASMSRPKEGPSLDKPIPNLPNGVPPLTPLRETMEGANDSSDETSFAFRTLPEQIKPVQGNKLDRVRVSPSQRQLDGETSPRTELNKAGRKKHTSSSSTSSGSNKLRPIRTSEDTLPSPTADADKNRAFEQLLQNDQTIQFTLTPQTMREIESPDSPRNPQPTVYSRGGDRPRASSSASKLTALHSNPTTPVSPTHRSSGRPTANSGAKVRPGVGQARDARVDRDSIGDFAEFIRSTGPPGATLDDLQPRSAPAINGHRGQNGTTRNASATLPRVDSVSGTPRRSDSSAARRRLQAREAVVPASNNSSDLIDFIRQGPPSDNTRTNPRIPRTVAPFRTTQDSDQMTGALGARVSELAGEEPRISQTSTNNSTNDQSTQSMQSSVSSQSALLNTYNPKKASTSPDFSGFDDQDMMPKRKTRRVKDPYAIDFSDEEDDDFGAPPAKPVRQEESLIDFLNNVPPPPAPTTPQPFDFSKPVAKKTSAPSLMARFSRNSVSHGKPPGSATTSSARSNNNTSPSTHIPISVSKPTSYPGNSSGKLTKTPSVSSSNYVSRLDSERKPARVQQISYQPREPTSNRPVQRTATTDLAEFLRNTPPPPMNGPQRLAIGGSGPDTKEEGGFSRMFGRRKKAAAA